MFTYSHANTPLGQSECTYYLSYFIKTWGIEERPVLAAREMKWEPKNERGGRGRGRKEGNAWRQTPRFWGVRQRTQRLISSASRTILSCVDQRFVSYWEVIYGTWHARCDCCLVWSARFTLLLLNAKLFLRLNKGIRSFNLFCKVPSGINFLLLGPGPYCGTFPSFLPHPLGFFYLCHFSCGLWFLFLVLCS